MALGNDSIEFEFWAPVHRQLDGRFLVHPNEVSTAGPEDALRIWSEQTLYWWQEKEANYPPIVKFNAVEVFEEDIRKREKNNEDMAKTK